ncbi:MAG: hypothetical protein CMM01_19855 [Rhodopirellula sp.]|nr:hypothetical protein [Rhodopirellula sp.]
MSKLPVNGSLIHSVCSPHSLSELDREGMLSLMNLYYDNVKSTQFFQDLMEKDLVICLRDTLDSTSVDTPNAMSGKILGFSTQQIFVHDFNGKSNRVLFSGDTVVSRKHWNSPLLARAWGRLAMGLIAKSSEPLYWLLLTKGYRTYRFLPLFFHQYAPSTERAGQLELDEMRHAFTRYLFGSAYNPATFTVRGRAIDNYFLRRGVADIDQARLRDQHVRRFLHLNPAYHHGDELSCLAPLTVDNFTDAARRVIGAEYF